MTFTSLSYLLFLPGIFILFNVAPATLRWPILLGGSIIFYATFKVPYLLGALFLVTGATYLAALRIETAESPRSKSRVMAAGVGINLAVLFLLKYLPPLWGSVMGVVHPAVSAHEVPILVSIGVSYYVFQAISYLVDVYLETERAEPHFGYFALYLSFFPKLLQGPIERAGTLLPQLKKPYTFDYDNVRRGLVLFCWGLWKKLVIADRVAIVVGAAYGDVHAYAGISLLIATYCYALQIYCDFSGYTDMARGTALLFNINLTENFNAPYLATSVADFWRRWHISFSRWILDYIFKPLQMWWRGLGDCGIALALVVTFLASGLWHGASWGFVVWGALHGSYMAASVLWRPYQKKVYGALGVKKWKGLKLWQILVTFHLVVYAWIFFRAKSVADGFFISRSIAGVAGGDLNLAALSRLIDIIGRNDALIAAAATCVLMLVGSLRRVRLFETPAYFRWPCYIALLGMILLLASFHGSSEFIYVQF